MDPAPGEPTVLIGEARHEAADGVLYAVCEIGVQRLPGVISSRRLQLRASRDGGRRWTDLPLRACPAHWFRARASDWPPPAALASSIVEGRLAIEYDSVYDPWEKAPPTALQAHARWLALYDPNWRWWTFRQQRLHGPEEVATR